MTADRRRVVSFALTLALVGATFYFAFSHEHTPHDAPAEILAAPETDAGAADASVVDASAPAPVAAAVDGAAAPAPAPAKALLDRPLRVAAVGWELFAPGVMGTEGAAESSLYGEGLTVELTESDAAAPVLGRLARGGADAQGADVAILPLPTFVASYDKLRALDPRVVLVVGWSHGQEELRAAVKPAPEPKAWVLGGDTVRFAGAFYLDANGKDLEKLKFSDEGDGKSASFFALPRFATAPEAAKIVFTTVDASRLVPFVAVAPRGVIDGQREALGRWVKGWLDGVGRVQTDAAAAAQRVAKARPGIAPDAVALVDRLGRVEHASLADNDAWLVQRRPVGFDVLVATTFRILRDANGGVGSAPDHAVVSPDLVSALVGDAGASAGTPPVAPVDAKGDALVATKLDAKVEAADVAERAALYLGVFPRATVRISMKGGEKAATELVSSLRDKVGPSGARLAVGKDAKGAGALVEVILAR